LQLLWVSHLVPYPPKSGVHLRAYHLLRAVAGAHDVDLVAFVQEPWLLTFFGDVAAGLAECRRALEGSCRSVTFLPIEKLRRPGGKLRAALEGLLPGHAYSLDWLWSPAAAATVAALGARHDYDLAHFDTLGVARYRARVPAVPATLGHHNVESHMMLRRADNEPSAPRRAYFREEGRRLLAYERRECAGYASNILCSELDAERLREVAPGCRTAVIPNGVDVDYFRPAPGRTERRSVIFVGSLNWYPNVDAVRFLLREVWPLVAAREPTLALDIVGPAPSDEIRALAAAFPNARVHGFVDDVRPLMDAAALYVCPIRDGGGTKLKILDAFAMQKCVLAHPIACEGIDAEPGTHVLLATTPAEFCDRILAALDGAPLRERIAAAARRLVVERYSFAGIGERLNEEFVAVARRRA
jgi:glycosyltransferase involved in cell wall biosynthesis